MRMPMVKNGTRLPKLTDLLLKFLPRDAPLVKDKRLGYKRRLKTLFP